MITKQEYRSRLKVSELLAKILELKQIPIETAYNILYNQDKLINIDETDEIINMTKAVKEFVSYINEGRDVYVYADYDVDGMTSGTIMAKFLPKVCKNKSQVYFPERSDGYGLSIAFIEKINEEYKDKLKPLLMTVDNGITKVEEVELCKKYGIPIIITDHHLPQEVLPDTIIVDQHISDLDHWAKGICGAGVAYYFCRAVERELGYNYYESSRLTYLAAIGTIADVMPLDNMVNQAIVRKGFNQIDANNIPNTLSTFIKQLTNTKINGDIVSWTIAPRLNSCSRMFDIMSSIRLFSVTQDPLEICANVEEYNNQRQKITKEYVGIIQKEYVDDSGIALVALDNIPHGIIGILAGKLEEYSGKPSFVGVKDGTIINGSARSNTYPLDVLLYGEPSVASYGGHAAACGFAIYQELVEEFKQALTAKILSFTPIDDGDIVVKPKQYIELTLRDLTKESFESFNILSYDKTGFEKPLVIIKDLTVLAIKPSGNNPLNIKYTVFDGDTKMDIWVWKLGDQGIDVGNRISLAGEIERNFMKPKLFTLKVSEIIKGG